VVFTEETFASQLRPRIFDVKTCKPLERSIEKRHVTINVPLRTLILINREDVYCDVEFGKSKERERSQGSGTKCFPDSTPSRRTNKRVPKFKGCAICRLALHSGTAECDMADHCLPLTFQGSQSVFAITFAFRHTCTHRPSSSTPVDTFVAMLVYSGGSSWHAPLAGERRYFVHGHGGLLVVARGRRAPRCYNHARHAGGCHTDGARHSASDIFR
jgi:hypothetical protein